MIFSRKLPYTEVLMAFAIFFTMVVIGAYQVHSQNVLGAVINTGRVFEGDLIDVTVFGSTLQTSDGSHVKSASLSFNFDPQVIKMLQITAPNNVLSLNQRFDTVAGTVSIDVAKIGPTSFSQSDPLFTMKYEVVYPQAGNTVITVNPDSSYGYPNKLKLTTTNLRIVINFDSELGGVDPTSDGGIFDVARVIGSSFEYDPAPGDYDGDGMTDIAVKTGSEQWQVDYAWNGFGSWDNVYYGYGGQRASLTQADYDGDDLTDLSVKIQEGTWLIDYSSNGFGSWDARAKGYGDETVTAVPGDYDGDGLVDLSVKTSGEYWLIDYAADGIGRWNFRAHGYGPRAVLPSPGDYDGDGKTDLSVKIPEGTWLIDYAKNGFGVWDAKPKGYGNNDSLPVPGDYDGDGITDLATIDTQGTWRIDYTRKGFNTWDHEMEGFMDWKYAVQGDYNGDGKDDLAIVDFDGVWKIKFL
jgi:hypothetical protein